MSEYDELVAAHERHMAERARLILDGADPADLLVPIYPMRPERRLPDHPLCTWPALIEQLREHDA